MFFKWKYRKRKLVRRLESKDGSSCPLSNNKDNQNVTIPSNMSCLFKVKEDANSCGRFHSPPLVSLRRIKGPFPFKCQDVSLITILNAVVLAGLNPPINTVNPNWWNNDKTKAQFAQCLINQDPLWHFIPSEITRGRWRASSFPKHCSPGQGFSVVLLNHWIPK